MDRPKVNKWGREPRLRDRLRSFVQAVQGNFDHLQGTLESLGDAHNTLANRSVEQADEITVLQQDVTGHSHDHGALTGLAGDHDAEYINEGQAAGGVLGGTYPNPSFAADMATQAELDTHAGTAHGSDGSDHDVLDHADADVAITPADGDVLTWNDTDGEWEPAAPTGGSGGNALPVGVVMAYGDTTAPTGWLVCDGSAVSRTTYDDLFAVVGTDFGAGDGSTTFNLPDLRQRFILGKSASGTGSTLGGLGGTVDHTHDAHNTSGIHGHDDHDTHSSAGSHAHGDHTLNQVSPRQGTSAGNVLTSPTTLTHDSIGGHTHDAHSSHSAEGGHSHTTHSAQNPPFQVLVYIICYDSALATSTPTTIIVQEGDSDVDTAVGTLDFDASDFNVTSSPSGEANIALAYGTGAGTPAEGNHTHAGGTGGGTVDTATGAVHTALPTALRAWLVADDLSDATGSGFGLADGAAVPVWPERVGFDRSDATEATNQPTVQTAEMNGHSVVRFDGSNDQLAIADRSYFSALNQDLTVFVVAEKPSATTSDNLCGKASNPYEWSLQNMTDGKMQASLFQSAGASHAGAITAGAISDNIPFIVVMRLDYLVELKIWLDGGAGTASTAFTAAMSDTSANIRLGQRGDGGGQGFWAGDIAEFLYFTRALSNEEIDVVLAYLGDKYNITVTACS